MLEVLVLWNLCKKNAADEMACGRAHGAASSIQYYCGSSSKESACLLGRLYSACSAGR